jgi:hypothetical protein
MWTPINASQEQIYKIYQKHLRFPVFSLKYSYDIEDNIGFVSFYVFKGHKVNYQIRNNKPCFVEFEMMCSNIRYDIHYPEGKVYDRLKELGIKAQKHFWKGGQI